MNNLTFYKSFISGLNIMDFSIKYASQAWALINFYITQSWEIANTVLWESLWNYQPTWVEQKQIMESFGEAKNWKPKVLKANFSYNLGAPFQLSLKAGHALLCKCCEWGLYYPFLIKLFLFQVAENSTQASLSKMGIYCIISQNMNNLTSYFQSWHDQDSINGTRV